MVWYRLRDLGRTSEGVAVKIPNMARHYADWHFNQLFQRQRLILLLHLESTVKLFNSRYRPRLEVLP
jgi:hypothetical protein